MKVLLAETSLAVVVLCAIALAAIGVFLLFQ